MIAKSVDGEFVEQSVQRLKRWVTQQDYLASAEVWRHAGLDAVLECLHTPTLVLKPRHCPCSRVEAAMELASRLPDGRLVLMDSDRPFGDSGQAVAAIDRFLVEVFGTHTSTDEDIACTELSVHSTTSCLTEREIEVLKLVAAGRRNQQIADELVISLNTVKRHVANIFDKTGAANRAEAATYAHHSQLL